MAQKSQQPGVQGFVRHLTSEVATAGANFLLSVLCNAFLNTVSMLGKPRLRERFSQKQLSWYLLSEG